MSLHLARYLRTKGRTVIDDAMGAAAVIHPLTATPQVVQIYSTHHAADVSLLTWLCFMALGVVFLAYAILHKIKPLIVTQVLWFIMDVLIVTGVLLYR
jgi:uncharacterized protein with PQ loop repeat